MGQPLGVVDVVARLGVLDDGFADGHAGKWLVQVDRLAVVGEVQGACSGHGRVADQAFGETHQVLVVPIRRVELHHGELGVVAHRDAFVAEVAVDLEHPFKAAHQQALEVELGRDAQEHLLVQRVVVRHKGLGVGTTGNGVQHGRFDFQKAVLDHEFANAAHGLAADHKAFAGGFVGHQVHIALAVLHFLVGDAVELVGHGAQALGEHADAGGVDRQLARAGFEQVAFDADDVAQVPVLEQGVEVFSHVVAGHIDLDAARGVLQRGKAGLAHDALEHHAACDFGHGFGHAFAVQGFGVFVAVGLVQIGGVVLGLEVIGKRHALAVGLRLAHGLEFFAALGDQLVFILRGWCGCGGVGLGVGHVVRLVGVGALSGPESGWLKKLQSCCPGFEQLCQGSQKQSQLF